MNNYNIPGVPSQQDVHNTMTEEQRLLLDSMIVTPNLKMDVTSPYMYNYSISGSSSVMNSETINFIPQNIMEVFVPMSYFIPNAKGFGQMDFRTHLNIVPMIITVIDVMCWISKRVSDEQQGKAYWTAEFLPMRLDYEDKSMKSKKNRKKNRLFSHSQDKHRSTNSTDEDEGDSSGISDRESNSNDDSIEEEEEDRIRRKRSKKKKDIKGSDMIDEYEVQDWKNLTEEDYKMLSRKYAGMRLRLALRDPAKLTIAAYVDELFKENGERMKKKLTQTQYRGVKQDPFANLAVYSLDYIKWKRICCMLTGKDFNIDDNNDSISFAKSPFNPCVAFAPLRSTYLALNAGAIEACCFKGNYVERYPYNPHDAIRSNRIKQWIFPYNGRWTYRLASDNMRPYQWRLFFFPTSKTSKYVVNEELELQRKLYSTKDVPRHLLDVGIEEIENDAPPLEGVGVDSEDEGTFQECSRAGSAFVNTTPEEVTRAYFRSGTNTRQEREMTMEHFRDLTKAEFDALNLKYKNATGSKKWTKARDELRQKIVDSFEIQMWQLDASICDSLKSIVNWGHEHLRSYKNFSIPKKHNCWNLSVTGDQVAEFLAINESIFGVKFFHKESLICLLSIWQIYMRTPFHAHLLLVGPAKAGKSFLYQLASEFLIKGTFKVLSYVTVKAKTGLAVGQSLYKLDLQVEFFEEMGPGQLGIEKAKSSAGNANTEAESIDKNRLTTGKISFQRVQNVDGEMKLVEAEISCNSIVMGATNASRQEIPPPTASRYNVVDCQIKERKNIDEQERVDIRTYINKTKHTRMAFDVFAFRMKRDQYLIAKISQLIFIGVLPEVDVTAALYVILGVLRLAGQRLLKGTGDVRNVERLKFLVHSLVLWRAIAIAFDSPLSPIKNKKWEPHHILAVEPYLYSTVEDASIVIGLLSHQFNDLVSHNVLESLSRYVKRNPVDVFTVTGEAEFHSYQQGDSEEVQAKKGLAAAAGKKKSGTVKDMANLAVNALHGFDYEQIVGNNNSTFAEAPIMKGLKEMANQARVQQNALEAKARKGAAVVAPVEHKGETIYEDAYLRARGPNTNTSNRAQSNEAIAHMLAAQLHQNMNPKPNIIDVEKHIDSYLEQMHDFMEVDNAFDQKTNQFVRRVVKKRDAILKFEIPFGGKNFAPVILLSKKVADECNNKAPVNKLMECVKDVICHPFARKSNILYGDVRNDMYYVAQCIMVEAPPLVPRPGDKLGRKVIDRKRIFKVLNPNYFNEQIKQITINSLDSVYYAYKGVTPEVDWDKLFAEQEGIVFRSDLDDYAVDYFNSKNRLTEEQSELVDIKTATGQMEKLPKNHPSVIKKMILSHHTKEQRDKMIAYPNDLKTSLDANNKRDPYDGLSESEDDEKKEEREANKENRVANQQSKKKRRWVDSRSEIQRLRLARQAENDVDVPDEELRLRRTDSEEIIGLLNENTRSTSSGSHDSYLQLELTNLNLNRSESNVAGDTLVPVEDDANFASDDSESDLDDDQLQLLREVNDDSEAEDESRNSYSSDEDMEAAMANVDVDALTSAQNAIQQQIQEDLVEISDSEDASEQQQEEEEATVEASSQSSDGEAEMQF